jgi:hypothetical protein
MDGTPEPTMRFGDYPEGATALDPRGLRVGTVYNKFLPYNDGPFSPGRLPSRGHPGLDGLRKCRSGQPAARSCSTCQATHGGIAMAPELRSATPADAVKDLDALVAWTRRRSRQQIVSAACSLAGVTLAEGDTRRSVGRG